MSNVVSDAPATNADVFKQYYYYVKYLISRYGFQPEFVEDMASIIFVKFIEKGVLEDYDPTRTWERNGKTKTASFQTFLSGFVIEYLYHYKTREARRAAIEAVSVDKTVSHADGSESLWLDANGYSAVDDLGSLDEIDLVTDVQKFIKTVRPTRSCTMEEFFQSVLEHVRKYGKVNVPLLAEEYSVTDTTIQNWMKRLRTHFDEARK